MTSLPSSKDSVAGTNPASNHCFGAAVREWFHERKMFLVLTKLVTVILFSVSVPVLSLQITFAAPRVSTVANLLTRTLRLASLWEAMAKQEVTVAGRPVVTLDS